jgi:hypothetical protein
VRNNFTITVKKATVSDKIRTLKFEMISCNICRRLFDNVRALRGHTAKGHKPKHDIHLPDVLDSQSNFYNYNDNIEDMEGIHEEYEQFQHDDQIENDIPQILEDAAIPGSSKYLDYQIQFSTNVYGPEAFKSKSWESFANAVRRKPQTKNRKKDLNALQLHNFCKTKGFTRRTSTELIKLINNVCDYNKDIPTGWSSIERIATGGVIEAGIPPLMTVVNYPERWCMDRWDTSKLGVEPESIKLLVRDPIACIAEHWMDPSITFFLKEHIKLEYQSEVQVNEGTII